MTPDQLCALGDLPGVAFMFHDRWLRRGPDRDRGALPVADHVAARGGRPRGRGGTILVSGTVGFREAFSPISLRATWKTAGTGSGPPSWPAVAGRGLVRSPPPSCGTARSAGATPSSTRSDRRRRWDSGARGHRASGCSRGRHDPDRRMDPRSSVPQDLAVMGLPSGDLHAANPGSSPSSGTIAPLRGGLFCEAPS